jgi:hypothetical protein
MNKLVLPAIDAARAKVLARAVQRRHQELGTTVSLNHAYEAVATACGFETWSRMKARLNDCDTDPAKSSSPNNTKLAQVLTESSLSFDDFVPHDFTPTVLISGPDITLRRRILSGLIAKWRLRHGECERVRVITKSPDADYIDQMQAGLTPKNRRGADASEVLWVTADSKLRLNPFDTPLGDRIPKQEHRKRLVDFLTLIISQNDQEIIGTTGLAGHLIDLAYDMLSDLSPKGQPVVFKRGVDKRIDDEVREMKTPQTWWDVSEKLAQGGYHDLAVQAQAYAVPVLEIMMRLLRSDAVEFTHGAAKASNGERLIDRAARRIASVIRECRHLQLPSSFTVDPSIRSVVIGVEDSGQHKFIETLTNKLFTDLSISPERSNDKERILVVLDGLDYVRRQNFLRENDHLFNGPDRRKFHIIILVTTVEKTEGLSEMSAVLMHGFSKRADVDNFRTMTNFSEGSYEHAHNLLFGEDHPGNVALGVRRGFRTTVDGMIAIP